MFNFRRTAKIARETETAAVAAYVPTSPVITVDEIARFLDENGVSMDFTVVSRDNDREITIFVMETAYGATYTAEFIWRAMGGPEGQAEVVDYATWRKDGEAVAIEVVVRSHGWIVG